MRFPGQKEGLCCGAASPTLVMLSVLPLPAVAAVFTSCDTLHKPSCAASSPAPAALCPGAVFWGLPKRILLLAQQDMENTSGQMEFLPWCVFRHSCCNAFAMGLPHPSGQGEVRVTRGQKDKMGCPSLCISLLPGNSRAPVSPWPWHHSMPCLTRRQPAYFAPCGYGRGGAVRFYTSADELSSSLLQTQAQTQWNVFHFWPIFPCCFYKSAGFCS